MTDPGVLPTAVQASPHHTAELHENIEAALAALPEPQRLAVSLRMQSGLSGNEVKEIMGCSAGEVSRQLHKGLDMLREKLASWQDTEMGVDDAM